MNTTKMAVRLLAELCRKNGMRKVVFSPGSRSAPIYIAFSQIPEIECIVIPDERVAGYFALGMAQQLRELVGVVCTSGTAVLNLAPSFYEAFYQQINMVYITADRPEGAYMRGENQAIEQIYALEPEGGSAVEIDGDEADMDELMAQLEDLQFRLSSTKHSYSGPVHVNVHLDEPLYDLTDEATPEFEIPDNSRNIDDGVLSLDKKTVQKEFISFKKKMILVGMHDPKPEFTRRLAQLSHRKDLVILRETTSNLPVKNSIMNLDATLSMLPEEDRESFVPDLVITPGNRVVSKRMRQFLKGQGVKHWDLEAQTYASQNWDDGEEVIDEVYRCHELDFLDALLETKESGYADDYRDKWFKASKYAKELSENFMKDIPFCDMKVFETLIASFPNDANIQYGNSTPVRYSNLFRHQTPGLTVNANRGTSGIDGCVSTAAGAAFANKRMTISIVGDISFFYDSNALWNNYLTPDFRIILINNSGGNIFRLIDGPSKLKGFEEFFETKHQLTAKHLAAHHQLPYYYCDNQKDLDEILKTFYEPHDGKPAILEIKTDGEQSAEVYKNYFDYLKQYA